MPTYPVDSLTLKFPGPSILFWKVAIPVDLRTVAVKIPTLKVPNVAPVLWIEELPISNPVECTLVSPT